MFDARGGGDALSCLLFLDAPIEERDYALVQDFGQKYLTPT
jgi:hypothetical protein